MKKRGIIDEGEMVYSYVELNRCVLAVAVVNTEMGVWGVYVGQTFDTNYDAEAKRVSMRGDIQDLDLASVLFSEYAEKYEYKI